MTLEVTIISNKKTDIISLYWSPSQLSDEFDSFTSNLEKLLINIISFDLYFVVILAGDFIAKSKSWSVMNITTEEGRILENLSYLLIWNEIIDLTALLELDWPRFVNQSNLKSLIFDY